MIRKLKVLGLALTAVLAMSAVVASASQAAVGSFTYGAGTVKVDGTQDPASPNQLFKFDAFSVTCNEVHGNATFFTATDVTLTSVTYQNSGSVDTCPSNAGTATVSMNGCGYTFTSGNTIAAGQTTAPELHVVCPAGALITISIPGLCTVDIPAQTIKGGHIVFKTIANGGGVGISAVTAEATGTSITYDQTGVFCPNGGTKHAANGTYSGNITITGTNAAGATTSVSMS